MATTNYVSAGCVVEFLEDNDVNIAFVLEESGGKVRLLLPNRRETKLSQNRLLPWIGPVYPATTGKEEASRLLDSHAKARATRTAQINSLELWELAQGEIDEAGADFFAGLVETNPDVDTVASYGRALLADKIRFRFAPPLFTVYDAETVETRLAEKKRREEREAFVSGGANFLRELWAVACGKRDSAPGDEPEPELAARLEKLLFDRLINPDTLEDDALWRLVAKGLPEAIHLPLQLLVAWGKLPRHYNFWLDRAGFERGDDWWREDGAAVDDIITAAGNAALQNCDLPFVSVDGATTRDIDDAFYLEQTPEGWKLTLAFAAPALFWPFASSLDKKVSRRATSLYLPEGDLHMLPERVGLEACSLLEGQSRPALCMRLNINFDGAITAFEPFLANVKLSANLRYDDVQAVLENRADSGNSALPYEKLLKIASQLGLARENKRIGDGAAVIRKPEQKIILEKDGDDVRVDLRAEPENLEAHRLVGEMMIAAAAGAADWAQEKGVPLVHRTQNVALPREYAGAWVNPEDVAAVMRAMAPSTMEIDARPHAALAAARYAPVTSPLRRYADLLNEAQILNFLKNGAPRWSAEELSGLLNAFSPELDAVSHAQKYRPRYWKLLYFKRQGDKIWWDGVITEENENYVTLALPKEGLIVRGKRALFDERAYPGARVKVRLGKVNPLYNEICILETAPAE